MEKRVVNVMGRLEKEWEQVPEGRRALERSEA